MLEYRSSRVADLGRKHPLSCEKEDSKNKEENDKHFCQVDESPGTTTGRNLLGLEEKMKAMEQQIREMQIRMENCGAIRQSP